MAEVATHRRQRRGVERIERILDAAAQVFARDGVDGATMAAIAAEAGISPGSLYQFFDHKQHVVRALGERHAADVTTIYRAAFAGVTADTSLDEVLDRVLDPLVALKAQHPAFTALFARPDLPDDLLGPIAEVERDFVAGVAQVLRERNGTMTDAAASASAGTVVWIVRGTIGSLGRVTGNADADLAELKLALRGYLEQKELG